MGSFMRAFPVRKLHKHLNKLLRRVSRGELSVLTRRGAPLLVVVPCDETILADGIGLDLAVRLFDEERISLGRAARLVGVSVSEMIDILGARGVAVIRANRETLAQELADFG